MFFIPPGLKPEETELLFKKYNELLKKNNELAEKKKKELDKEKKRQEIYEMMRKNPTTSFTGMIAYGNMLAQLNNE